MLNQPKDSKTNDLIICNLLFPASIIHPRTVSSSGQIHHIQADGAEGAAGAAGPEGSEWPEVSEGAEGTAAV